MRAAKEVSRGHAEDRAPREAHRQRRDRVGYDVKPDYRVTAGHRKRIALRVVSTHSTLFV